MDKKFVILIFFFSTLAFLAPQILIPFKGLIPFLLGLVMLAMGMTIDLKDLKKTFKNPKWIIVGIFLQYTLMPFFAFILSIILELSNELLLGMIILGSCPGGTASNVIAYLSRANLPLSISLTLISTLLSFVFTPLLILLYGKQLIDIELKNLITTTFLIIIIPITLGIILKKFLKKNIDIFTNYAPLLSQFIIAFIIGVILSLNSSDILEINYKLFLAIILHNMLGIMSGYFCSKLLKFPKDVRKTIAIEVGMQNSGLGVSLSLIHFTKIVALPSALFSLWHNISAIVLINLWTKKK